MLSVLVNSMILGQKMERLLAIVNAVTFTTHIHTHTHKCIIRTRVFKL